MTHGLQVTSAPAHLVQRMMKYTGEGWSNAPPAASTWIASMLEPGVYRRPEFMAVTGPSYTRAATVAAERVPLQNMQDAWQLQTMRVLTAADPWKMVQGPAGGRRRRS